MNQTMLFKGFGSTCNLVTTPKTCDASDGLPKLLEMS